MQALVIGKCEHIGCLGYWISTRKNRKYCDDCKYTYHVIPVSMQNEVLRRDNWTCQVCGRHYDVRSSIDLHHKNVGGSTSIANLVTVCSNKLGKQSCHYKVHNIIKLTASHLTSEQAYELLRDTFADERETRLVGSLG